MKDALFDYWREALECALDGANIDMSKITPEQLDLATHSLMISRDQESMAFGYDHIPNPMGTEVSELKAKTRQIELEHDQREQLWSATVAERLRVTPGKRVGLDQDGRLIAYGGITEEI